ncbi:DUF1330 domain-containing protein [Phaeobacter gallaeciensis]|uniref:DUF1330 domain-containing protein n=1 Tax=Phaeobacter gallaeciensis TaxID=60890 RepID=UPI00237F4290|nr:DUF1330 domain-containing protein [Phaeobacter gallaeciensis]MDE4063568.1 DUF1330 domain-containing protein [Phaeobacter gallaeciensis]MDE4126588.1 DUF1330 domain-containing protein [Phaeobacter gallaeciensis]MDE4131065.1 DUF1330 domain-containing protein [Phaeobacter gallaeciensis]
MKHGSQNRPLHRRKRITVYAYVNLPITNPDSFAAYREKAGAALAKHGVRVVTSSPQQRVIEGSRDETGVGVILEFDSTEAALGWINDEELKEVHGLRQAAGNGAITLLG